MYKISNENKKAIRDLMDLSFHMSENSDVEIFVSISPHCAYCSVYIYLRGFVNSPGNERDANFYFWYDSEFGDSGKQVFEKVLAYLSEKCTGELGLSVDLFPITKKG